MRRILAALICIVLLCVPVFADNAAASCSSTATVSPTGSCQIVLNADLRLDEPVDSLTFPLGSNVSSVSLNGGRASTTTVGDVTHIKLNYLANQVGTFSITVHFTADNVVEVDEDGRQFVRIPLLSGFRYPVERLSFSVTMPGSFTDEPEFFSGYHEQDIEKSMTFSVSGVTVSGFINTPLKDRETLCMKLDAPEGMFPLAVAAGQTVFFDRIGMAVCAALAMLYWLLTMRRRPFWPGSNPVPPEGLSAGMVGTYLVHAPADLNLMVIQWAQMGYLEIRLDRRGRVFLRQKMEMGNERSPMEGRCFRALFSRHSRMEATSARYARLCQQIAANSMRRPVGLLPSTGNPGLFRILCCGVALFAGIAMGDSLCVSSAVMRIVLMVAMGLLSAFACWHMQQGMFRLHLRGRRDLYYSLAAAAGIVVLSALCGAHLFGVITAVWGLVTGILAAYGGRRTENGQQICMGILSLRRFLRTVSSAELQRILRSNPSYYYDLAPFALALGVDGHFARHCADARLPACKWLITDGPEIRTSQEWYPLLRETLRLMDQPGKRPLWKILLNLS